MSDHQSTLPLAGQLADEIRALARQALAKGLGPAAAREARDRVCRPVDYMRHAEFDAVLRWLDLRDGMRVVDFSGPALKETSVDEAAAGNGLRAPTDLTPTQFSWFAPIAPGLVVTRIDAEEELARLHRAVVVHVDLGDVAPDLRADDDDAAFHVRVVGGDALRALPPGMAAPAEGGEGRHDGQGDQTPVSHRGVCYHPRDGTTRGRRAAPGSPAPT